MQECKRTSSLSHVATTLIWFDTKSLERPFPFHVTSNTGLDRVVIGHLSTRLLASVCPHSHLLVGQNSYLALLAIVSTDDLIKQVHKTHSVLQLRKEIH
jgi:hypothetical protein